MTSVVATTGKRAGRPKGSKTKKPAKLLLWLERAHEKGMDYDHPLYILIALANGDCGQFDKEGNPIPVPLDIQVQAAVKAMPYLASPMAVQINHADNQGNKLEVSPADKLATLVMDEMEKRGILNSSEAEEPAGMLTDDSENRVLADQLAESVVAVA